MWAVLSKEEIPFLKIEPRILTTEDGPVGLLDVVQADLATLPLRHYTALHIHVRPENVVWLDRLAEAAAKLAADLRLEITKSEIAAQQAKEDAEAERLIRKTLSDDDARRFEEWKADKDAEEGAAQAAVVIPSPANLKDIPF